MTRPPLRRARTQALRGALAGLLALVGVLALGTGIAYAEPSATGTAVRAADDSVAGTLTAVGLTNPDGSRFEALYNGVVWGRATSTGGEVVIPYEIAPDEVPPGDCAFTMFVKNDRDVFLPVDLVITGCGAGTTPPTPPTTATPSATTSPPATSTSRPPSTSPTSSPTGTTTVAPTGTTTSTPGPTATATATATYVPGPGGTGDGAVSDPAWVGLGFAALLGAAALAVPILRRR